MQVPAEIFISDKQHLKAIQSCQLIIGGIVVKDQACTGSPLRAVNLLQCPFPLSPKVSSKPDYCMTSIKSSSAERVASTIPPRPGGDHDRSKICLLTSTSYLLLPRCRYLGSKRCDKVTLQSLVVKPRGFFTNWVFAQSCLQKLTGLKSLDLKMDLEDVHLLCQAVPSGLLKLILNLSSKSVPNTAILQNLTQLTQLEVRSCQSGNTACSPVWEG
jgi:hypothetical protein